MDECYNTTYWGLNKEVYNETYGAIVPRYCGALSVIGSACINIIILRSEAGLSSSYHRIMFGMSVADILSSIAMALTSLAIPKHGLNKDGIVVDLHFEKVPTYGNTATCEAQGFFFIFGTVATYGYNLSLCLYFMFAIYCMRKDAEIKKRITPFLVVVPVILALLVAVPPLFLNQYNPSTGMAWCTIARCPQYCSAERCIRGSEKFDNFLNTVMILVVALFFITMITSYVCICYKVYKQTKLLSDLRNAQDQPSTADGELPGNDDNRQIKLSLFSRNRTLKIVLIQSLAYILSMLSTVIIRIVILLRKLVERKSPGFFTERKIRLVLIPLQGIFNFVIFVSSKIANERTANPERPICEIIVGLFRGSIDDPVILTGLNLIQDKDGNIMVESNIDDEGGASYDSAAWKNFSSRTSTGHGDVGSGADGVSSSGGQSRLSNFGLSSASPSSQGLSVSRLSSGLSGGLSSGFSNAGLSVSLSGGGVSNYGDISMSEAGMSTNEGSASVPVSLPSIDERRTKRRGRL